MPRIVNMDAARRSLDVHFCNLHMLMQRDLSTYALIESNYSQQRSKLLSLSALK
jgi:hypothetical protein